MKLPIIIDHLRNALETHQFGALADERADLFNHLQQEQRDVFLPVLFHAEQENLLRLSAYQEGTASAIMTSDKACISVRAALAELKQAGALLPNQKEWC